MNAFEKYPLPWHVDGDRGRVQIMDVDCNPVVTVLGEKRSEALAIAAEIVSRVNTHEALMAALRACQYELVTLEPRLTEPYRKNVRAALEAAREAIASTA